MAVFSRFYMYDTSKRCATYKIDRFLYYIFSRNQIVFQSTFQNLKGSIYLCFHCTDGDSQFICDLLVLESIYTTQFKNGFTLIW